MIHVMVHVFEITFHVLDLAQAHVKGMNYLFQEDSSSQIFNLGTEKRLYRQKKSLKLLKNY